MNVEELKKLAEEEFVNNTMKHLDSGLIFAYIKNLEDRIDKAIELIKKTLNIHSDYVEYDFGTEYLRQELLDILQGSDKE